METTMLLIGLLISVLAAIRTGWVPMGMQFIVDEENADHDKDTPEKLLKEFDNPTPAADPEKKDPPAEKKDTPDPNDKKDPPVPEKKTEDANVVKHEGKVYRLDKEKGQIVIEEEVEQTEDEKAAELAAAAAAKAGAAPQRTAAEIETRTAEALTKLQETFDGLAKEYPELAALIPAPVAGEGIKGMLTRYNSLAQKVADQDAARERREEQELDLTPGSVKMTQQAQQFIEQEALRLVSLNLPAGVTKIPATDAEWDALYDENPRGARKLDDALSEQRRNVQNAIIQVQAAASAQKEHNAAVVEADFAALTQAMQKTIDGLTADQVKELKLTPMTEAEFITFARKHLNDPRINTSRHGVNFLRKGGFVELWKTLNHDNIVQAVALARETSARRDTVAKLNKTKPETIVVGATAPGQGRTKRETRIDLHDEQAIEKLGLGPDELLALYDRT